MTKGTIIYGERHFGTIRVITRNSSEPRVGYSRQNLG